MQIIIQKNKISNLYSFISNLSQWNELVCVPNRKKEWIKTTGKLNEKENECLKVFSKIMQESTNNLELIFLFSDKKDIWQKISKEIGNEKTIILKQIFSYFRSRFNILWKEEEDKIKIIEKYFNRNINLIDNNLNVIKSLCNLSNQKVNERITLNLLLSSSKKTDCQAWYYNNIIVLEASGWPKENLDELLNSIFLHECFHLYFQKNKLLFSNLKKLASKNKKNINRLDLKHWPVEVILEECLVSSFLPEGYLSEKFLKKDVKKIASKKIESKNIDQFSKIRYFCALNLYKNAKNYVENKKTLDIFYFNDLVKSVNKFI